MRRFTVRKFCSGVKTTGVADQPFASASEGSSLEDSVTQRSFWRDQVCDSWIPSAILAQDRNRDGAI